MSIKNKITLDTNLIVVQELTNFPKLVIGVRSSAGHILNANDYQKDDILKAFLLDLILVLMLFKKDEPKNLFFNQENKYDLNKKQNDEHQLDKFISITGGIRGLVYDKHFNFSSPNFMLECWRILVETKMEHPTHIKIGSVNSISAGDHLKTLLNKLLKSEEVQGNIVYYIDSIVQGNRSHNNHNEIETEDQNGIAHLLDSMLDSKKQKEVCFEPGLLGLNNKQVNVHFLLSSFDIDAGFHNYYNKDLIRAKALNTSLKTVLTYTRDARNYTPQWGSSGSFGHDPILIYNTENIPIKFDLIALEITDSLEIANSSPRKQIKESKSSKSTHFINELERFFKLLNNKGKLILIFRKHVLNRHRKNLVSLFDQTTSIINLKRKTIIIANRNPQKNVSIFNAETLNMDTSIRLQGFQARSDYKTITKEYQNKSGDYWREISRHQLLDECKNSFNINKFFMPEIKGIDLGKVVKVLKTERTKPDKTDVLINVSSLRSIPGILDLEKKTETSRKLIPSCLKVEKSCLLIGMIGNKLKPTEFIYKGSPIYLMPGVIPLEINKSITSTEFVLYALRSEETKTQLKFISTGSVIPRFKIKDILNLKINCPNNKIAQQTIINERKESVFGELQLDKILKETQKERFKKIRRISHDMGDYFSNIFPNIDMILESVYSKNEKDINKFFNDDDLNLTENLKILQNDINSLSILNSQFKEDLDFDKKYPLKMYTALDIYKLTLKILKSYKSKLFSSKVQLRILDLLYDENKKLSNKDFNNFEYNKLGYKLNEDAYERFIRQFVRNTEKHAEFKENKKIENKFIIRFDFDELNLNLIIMNNGKPFPENWTKERFIQHGETTNFKDGNGDGGEIINDICNYFQINDWTLEMNNDDNFPVKFKFPLSLEPIE